MPSGNPQPPRGYRVMEERFAMAGDPRWQQGVAPEKEPCVHQNVHTGAQFGLNPETPPELFAECMDCGARWSAEGVRTE